MNELVLCFVGNTQQTVPPMVIVGRKSVDDDNNIIITGPMSADVTYFSLVGNRLKPLADKMELDRSKEDKSLRALPQLSPSDFVLMGTSSYSEYMEATMIFEKSNIVYMTPLAEDSSFGIAYRLMAEAMSESTALSKFFDESLFDFDVESYLKRLMDPDQIKDVLVPNVIGSEHQQG